MNMSIITGTRSGIGRALARALEADGWSVHGLNRPTFDLNNLHDHLDRLNGVLSLVRDGGFDRKVFIMNAAEMHVGPAMDATAAERIIRVNLTAHMKIAGLFMHACLKDKTKCEIALVSSMAARMPSRYWAFYAASKAGLEAYLRCIETEGYPVHLLVPIAVDTQMQTKLRETDWPEAAFYKNLQETGRLKSPEEVVSGWIGRLNNPAVPRAPRDVKTSA